MVAVLKERTKTRDLDMEASRPRRMIVCTAVNIKDLEPYKKQLISEADKLMMRSK